MKESINFILDKFLDSRLDNIHTILPGEVVSYEGHTQRKATIKPMIKLRTHLNKIIEIQPIDNVPVIFPSTKQFNFLFPINKGDGVLLLFSESGIGNYLNSTITATADDLRRFDLSDCIAIPGMWSFRNVPNSATNKIELDSSGKITINGNSGIDLQTGASESFLKGDTMVIALTALCATIAGATSGTTAQNAAGIETIKTAFATFSAQLNNFKSTLIKGV